MPKFITATSLVLFAAFYQLSGGTEFEPQERNVAEAQSPFAIESNSLMFNTPENAGDDVVVRVGYTVTPAPSAPASNGESMIQNASLSTEIAGSAEPGINTNLLEDTMDIRLVSGDWVNMRSGPGTTYEVLNTLPSGTVTELIDTDGNWAKLRVNETGEIGWMSLNLLTEG